jgi:hypothetical protein
MTEPFIRDFYAQGVDRFGIVTIRLKPNMGPDPRKPRRIRRQMTQGPRRYACRVAAGGVVAAPRQRVHFDRAPPETESPREPFPPLQTAIFWP